MPIWILVSDASRATLYGTEKRGDDWQVIGSYGHPESRLKNSELTSTGTPPNRRADRDALRSNRTRPPNRLRWSISPSNSPICWALAQ